MAELTSTSVDPSADLARLEHPDGPAVTVIADSVSAHTGDRIASFEIRTHRFVLAEWNTHCLAGDTLLEFDSPRTNRAKSTMAIADFVDKWQRGARRIGTNPRRPIDMSSFQDDLSYELREASGMMGFANPSHIYAEARSGALLATKVRRQWVATGSDLKRWRADVPAHSRFDIRDRLSRMRIRQLDERTGLIVPGHVVDARCTGSKLVYRVSTVSGRVVRATDEHPFFTPLGRYLPLRCLRPGDEIVVRRYGKRAEDVLDPDRLKIVGGVRRSQWQREQRARLLEEHGGCEVCGATAGLAVHHIVPVHVDPSLAFEGDNIRLLCQDCHFAEHSDQSTYRKGGTYLYGGPDTIESITPAGVEPVYDLEVEGPWHNFLANGIVVHNCLASRNSASSRAIPVSKQLDRYRGDPAWPISWPAERPGMSGGDELEGDELALARDLFARVHDLTAAAVDEYLADTERTGRPRLHKSVLNRLLEPLQWHTMLFTLALPAHNFFAQRADPGAQPELRVCAEMMRELVGISEPAVLGTGQWHLPYLRPGEDLGDADPRLVSAARCARTSFLGQSVERPAQADVDLCLSKLIPSNHWSPFEHVATPQAHNVRWGSVRDPLDPGRSVEVRRAEVGKFPGWVQLRHLLEAAHGWDSYR